MVDQLGRFEQLLLFAILHLGTEAYGVTMRREVEERTGKSVASGAVYTTLRRLEERGLVSSRVGEPTAERGGRRKKFYRVERAGIRALHESYQILRGMAEGLEPSLDELAARIDGAELS
jgi:DNA-binding PadR family transcriptional regulator